jgi:hypothetical protein
MSFPDWLGEAAIAHAKGDKVEAPYKRGDALAKRRELMDEWARYCGTPAMRDAISNIVSMPMQAVGR